MKQAHYHLAQVNIARALAPLDQPVMSGFVNQLAALNTLADRSPGFVWRMQSETGDNTYLRPYEDPLIIFNLSVWESVEALRQYVYQSGHVKAIRNRKSWFDKMDAPQFALWWIPAGHIPSVEEAKERLRHRELNGDTAMAFSFSSPFEMPLEPGSDSADEVLATIQPDYDGKVFSLLSRSEQGDCGAETLFQYRQQGSRVWATYEGGGVKFGTLVAVADSAGHLHGSYQHLTSANEVRVGTYVGTRERLTDARLVITESWRTSSGNGQSVLRELR